MNELDKQLNLGRIKVLQDCLKSIEEFTFSSFLNQALRKRRIEEYKNDLADEFTVKSFIDYYDRE